MDEQKYTDAYRHFAQVRDLPLLGKSIMGAWEHMRCQGADAPAEACLAADDLSNNLPNRVAFKEMMKDKSEGRY